MWSTDSLLKTNSCTSFSRAKGRSFLQEPWDYTEVVRGFEFPYAPAFHAMWPYCFANHGGGLSQYIKKIK